MSMFPPNLVAQATALLESCRQRQLMLATAESCTGGLLSALITELPSSDVFTYGYVTYANIAKFKLLGVSEWKLKRNGAVSAEVARAMAEGALKHSNAQLTIAITGIAGPTGAQPGKPVGLVHFASARSGFNLLERKEIFSGDRASIRLQAVSMAIELLQQQLNR